jgi:hypothetical protein
MRVPIENGSGFFNQVSDFIKLSAAYCFWVKERVMKRMITEFQISRSLFPHHH